MWGVSHFNVNTRSSWDKLTSRNTTNTCRRPGALRPWKVCTLTWRLTDTPGNSITSLEFYNEPGIPQPFWESESCTEIEIKTNINKIKLTQNGQHPRDTRHHLNANQFSPGVHELSAARGADAHRHTDTDRLTQRLTAESVLMWDEKWAGLDWAAETTNTSAAALNGRHALFPRTRTEASAASRWAGKFRFCGAPRHSRTADGCFKIKAQREYQSDNLLFSAFYNVFHKMWTSSDNAIIMMMMMNGARHWIWFRAFNLTVSQEIETHALGW